MTHDKKLDIILISRLTLQWSEILISFFYSLIFVLFCFVQHQYRTVTTESGLLLFFFFFFFFPPMSWCLTSGHRQQ